MKEILIIILIIFLQACAPIATSPFQPPENEQPHAVLQSAMHKVNFFTLSEGVLKIISINGAPINPREEETWKLAPYSKFNIFPGDTFVEVRHRTNGNFGYIRFTAKPNNRYTISYLDNPDKQAFTLLVENAQGEALSRHSFRKRQWGEYSHSVNEELMFDAIAMNDINAVQNLLKKGANPNWIDANTSLSALYITAKENNIAILNLLIASGVWVDSYKGAYALSICAESGHLEMLKILLSHGADPNLRGFLDYSALMEASQNGHTQIVQYLLSHGAYTEFRDFDGKKAIDLAKELGHEKIIQILSQPALEID